jgi:ComF family protein
VAKYEGVIRECIHSLKYENNQSLGEYFSRDLMQCINKENWHLDLVIPVPLSPFRIKERGYNQSALLARPLAIGLSLRYQPYGLKRIRNTQSQVELNVEERRMNVAGAFQAVPEIVQGKNVLLVDDVTTTGSTINECAKALKSGGARAVYCLALARPIHDEGFVGFNFSSSII